MDKISFIQKLQIPNQLNAVRKKSISFLRAMPYDSVEIYGRKKQGFFSRISNNITSFFKKKPEILSSNAPILTELTERQKQIQLLKSPSLPRLSISDKEVEGLLEGLDDSQMSKFTELYSKKIWFVEHLASLEAQGADLEKLSSADKDKIRINSLKNFITAFYDEKNPSLLSKAQTSIYNDNRTIAKTLEILDAPSAPIAPSAPVMPSVPKKAAKNIEIKKDTLPSVQKIKAEKSAVAPAEKAAAVVSGSFEKEAESIKNQLSESLHLYKPLSDVSENYWAFYKYSKNLNLKSTDDYIKMFQELVEASGKDLNQADLASICENFAFDKKLISSADFGDVSLDSVDRVKQKLSRVSDTFSELRDLILTTPKNANESCSEYLKRINSKYQTSLGKKHTEREIALQSRLKFFESSENIEKINLTASEKQKLVDIINSWLSESDKVSIDTPMKDLAYRWKQKYVSGGVFGMDSRLEDACIQEFKRYTSADDKFVKKASRPVYRWLSIQENMGDFLKKMPEEGEIYCPGRLQSCSKMRAGAETCFHDNNTSMNVKFVIYPKSQTSKAYDIGDGKYGALEVIYPSGSKFKVLYKDIEEIKHDDKLMLPAMESNTKTGSHMQAVIYMQEV